ncbi:MAG: hypothetical protein IT303_14195 [Dehalococcoidia bacterium]|nr:hypothetical protein [Dehalococcoidia bacterium]
MKLRRHHLGFLLGLVLLAAAGMAVFIRGDLAAALAVTSVFAAAWAAQLAARDRRRETRDDDPGNSPDPD